MKTGPIKGKRVVETTVIVRAIADNDEWVSRCTAQSLVNLAKEKEFHEGCYKKGKKWEYIIPNPFGPGTVKTLVQVTFKQWDRRPDPPFSPIPDNYKGEIKQ
jgi:hypothetical protein